MDEKLSPKCNYEDFNGAQRIPSEQNGVLHRFQLRYSNLSKVTIDPCHAAAILDLKRSWKGMKMVIAGMDTPKYGETLRDT